MLILLLNAEVHAKVNKATAGKPFTDIEKNKPERQLSHDVRQAPSGTPSSTPVSMWVS